MSSIGAIGSMSSMPPMQGVHRRPDPAQLADKLFEKLDSKDQGFLQQTDFAAAFGSIASSTVSSDSTVDVEALFTQLDADSDGKLTQQEFADSVSKLAEQLDQQFQSMRMREAMGGPGGAGGPGGKPPPPPAGDEGFTEDELSSQLAEIGSSDSKRASLISNILENFDAADSDGDGKVSFREAMAFDESNRGESLKNAGGARADAASQSAAGSQDDGQLFLQIMRLMQAYSAGQRTNEATSSLSVTA